MATLVLGYKQEMALPQLNIANGTWVPVYKEFPTKPTNFLLENVKKLLVIYTRIILVSDR